MHMKGFFSFAELCRWVSPRQSENPELARLRQENENLKSDLKNFSTIINMAPYPMWQRDSSLALRYYNLSYSEAVEDLSEKSEGSETPELDKKARAMAAQAFETGKAVSAGCMTSWNFQCQKKGYPLALPLMFPNWKY